MNENSVTTLERRVLVLATANKDAALAKSVLARAGVDAIVCLDLAGVCSELDAGASALLIPEESMAEGGRDMLARYLAKQPPWSDLPLLILARPGADSASLAEAMDLLGNVTVLERPMRVAALVSAVRTALRARRRQYQIREHLIERQRAEDALRTADRRKDEFLAILAHELRNPLAPIRNSLAVLKLSARRDPTALKVSDMMERQVNHMVRLVDDLLEVSRITRGKIRLRKEAVDIADVVGHAIDTSRPMIEAAGHELVVDLPGRSLIVDGDPVRLSQVFANLLNNAAKYTNAGGRIHVVAEQDGDVAVVCVRDNGMGIPPDKLPRVFELFMQVDLSAARSHGGLGIGLTLVKSIVELHGGSVLARSDGPGAGSEFVVRLPLADVPAARAVLPSGPSASALPTAPRILVVDDNRDAAESLAMVLRLLGVSVQIANSGREALERVARFRPSAVLLDLGMPEMDGYEVARRLRESREHREVKLVALTGWGQDDDRRRTRSAGFDLHLTKPADVGTLQALLVSLEQPTQAGAQVG